MPTQTDVLSACLRLTRSLYGSADLAVKIGTGEIALALSVDGEEKHSARGRDPGAAFEDLHKAMRSAAEEKLEAAREAHKKAAEALAAAKAAEETLLEEMGEQ